MRKIITLLFSLLITTNLAHAESITKSIISAGGNKASVSVSIKDISTGNSVYSLNEKKPMIPASTLKLITTSASIDTLGKDFKYITTLYKSTNNDLYL